MDDLERRYAALVADLVGGMGLERVAADADRLAADSPDTRLRALARGIGAAARARAGEPLDAEAVVDAPLPAVDAAGTVERLEDALPGPGSLTGRLAGFRASIRIPPEALEPAAERLLQLLRRRAREDLAVPEGESVSLRTVAVPGAPWRVRADCEGPRTVLKLNASAAWTPDRLAAVIAREAYPGRHLARLMGAGNDADGIPSPALTVRRGREDVGREILLADHELARELERIASDPVPRWDGAAILRVRRALDARAPAVALAALESGRRDVRGDLAALAIGEDRAEALVKQWSDPLARAGALARGAGPSLVRRWLETTGQTVGLGRLLSERLVPSQLRAEIDDGGG